LRILDYSWDLVTSVGRRDHESIKLILDASLAKPVLTADPKGMVLKVPVPRYDPKGFFTLHGLYFDADERSWTGLWRLYRASIYHGAMHAAYSSFKEYAGWAKGKDLTTATYIVSLLEDYRVTRKAAIDWPGIIPDIAYANFNSALRVKNVDGIVGSERFATKLLLDLWGVSHSLRGDKEEDFEVQKLANQVRAAVDESVGGKEEYPTAVFAAAEAVYAALSRRGRLREVPSFPYTESHRDCSIFNDQVVEVEDPRSLEESALAALGLGKSSITQDDSEAKEFFGSMRDGEAKLQKIREGYEKMVSSTRLQGVEYPKGDLANYLRIRSSLSGPIRNMRDQLRLVQNVLDETHGHESGNIDTQAAMQVVASGQMRSDVFVRDELANKNEAWAILIDASKSTSSFSHEVKGISTCLAEVAKELMPLQSQWGVFSFNNTFQILKDFKEEYTSDTKARIGGIEQRNVTMLPDAISIAHRALSAQPVDARVLVVASDGYPTGYSGIEKALVSTVKQVSNSGTLLMGLGIDSHEIEEYFTVNCVVNSPYQMMKSFIKSYLELASLF
jgi:hypothetical protein